MESPVYQLRRTRNSEIFPLKIGKTTFGRSAEYCDISINSKLISKLQLEINVEASGSIFVQNKSQYGTVINNKREMEKVQVKFGSKIIFSKKFNGKNEIEEFVFEHLSKFVQTSDKEVEIVEKDVNVIEINDDEEDVIEVKEVQKENLKGIEEKRSIQVISVAIIEPFVIEDTQDEIYVEDDKETVKSEKTKVYKEITLKEAEKQVNVGIQKEIIGKKVSPLKLVKIREGYFRVKTYENQ